MSGGEFRLSRSTLRLHPTDRWAWTLGHYYIRNNSTNAAGLGNNLISSIISYRFNENWAARMAQHFETRDGRMEEQYYSLFRDFRSWTGALTFRVRGNRAGKDDYAVAFTFSLKAKPRTSLSDDPATPYPLLGL